ncbi:hypothetical protein HMPREF3208_01245 [Gardnerella vaginalis]|uniref:Uncharacterized protein n=1 Tax=Gardnerella vaginalis TaxID=2702 RepID=A0A133NRZ7_GARVA|nr:hypothetical protein HMPREF3208_01245 [Gardnerella vaginalis]
MPATLVERDLWSMVFIFSTTCRQTVKNTAWRIKIGNNNKKNATS